MLAPSDNAPGVRRPLPRWAPLIVVLAGLVAFAAYAAWGIKSDPNVVMLLPKDGAAWIKSPAETDLFSVPPEDTMVLFRHDFTLTESTSSPVDVDVIAFRRVHVYLDRSPILEETAVPANWKHPRRIVLPMPLAPGPHSFLFAVFNDTGPPALRVSAPALGIASSTVWITSVDGQNWVQAWPVSRIAPPEIATAFPSPADQFGEIAPLLLLVCLIAAALSWRSGTPDTAVARVAAWITPARTRFVIQLVLLVLGLRTMFIANLMIGADAPHHYDHVHWYNDHFGVPRADEGAQHFQAPLFYWTANTVHRLLSVVAGHDWVDHAVRILPVLCGVALVELIYRMLRRSFPGDARTQFAGLVAGSFVPLLVYKTQFVSNEPFAAMFGAAAVLALLWLADGGHASGTGRFALCGALWGLAVLAKVSAVVLAVPFGLLLMFWSYSTQSQPRVALLRIGTFALAFLLTCGWYIALNLVRYGKPFIGGWGAEVGYAWWQAPGYRAPEQFLSFGAALVRPVFASVYGFWDAMYAELWFDSTLGGIINTVNHPKWDYRFAESALLWALVATSAVAGGALRAIVFPRTAPGADNAQIVRTFSLFTVGAYGAAVLAFTLSLPYYAPIKPTYGMAALPSLAVLIALGLQPLTRYRITRALLHAWLAGWVVLVCAGYWVLAP